jgi:hypothetical protein
MPAREKNVTLNPRGKGMTAIEKYEAAITRRVTVKLSRKEAKEVFDARARKLVRMSGEKALKKIKKGKCGPNLAWSELILFASLVQ